ncbi:hypothetical protein AVEN_116783-1 [Araneus ventricosus]|uniref:Uncharacterized protein n=1 Tax=Araneus ventricosus TaxID=182803 RepID=A0A4Y2D6K9_ARAVE|nr:hypothetical protein AVEN_116783-1 [Araneus ventricosus]
MMTSCLRSCRIFIVYESCQGSLVLNNIYTPRRKVFSTGLQEMKGFCNLWLQKFSHSTKTPSAVGTPMASEPAPLLQAPAPHSGRIYEPAEFDVYQPSLHSSSVESGFEPETFRFRSRVLTTRLQPHFAN